MNDIIKKIIEKVNTYVYSASFSKNIIDQSRLVNISGNGGNHSPLDGTFVAAGYTLVAAGFAAGFAAAHERSKMRKITEIQVIKIKNISLY